MKTIPIYINEKVIAYLEKEFVDSWIEWAVNFRALVTRKNTKRNLNRQLITVRDIKNKRGFRIMVMFQVLDKDIRTLNWDSEYSILSHFIRYMPIQYNKPVCYNHQCNFDEELELIENRFGEDN